MEWKPDCEEADVGRVAENRRVGLDPAIEQLKLRRTTIMIGIGREEPFLDLGNLSSGLLLGETAIVFCDCKGLPMISRIAARIRKCVICPSRFR